VTGIAVEAPISSQWYLQIRILYCRRGKGCICRYST